MFQNLQEVLISAMYTPISTSEPIYQADASMLHAIQQNREHLHHVCRQHMNRRVMVHTSDGHTHEGVIVGFDDHYLYLNIAVSVEMRQLYPAALSPFYNPLYAQTILPLVLFNLLTITLLYT